MISLIREHNALNGLRFSVAEFLVTSVIAISVGIYFTNEGEIAWAIALFGIGANCLVVVTVGVLALRAGEPEQRLRATFSPSARARILRDHPRAQRATWILASLTLIPLALPALTLAEIARGPDQVA